MKSNDVTLFLQEIAIFVATGLWLVCACASQRAWRPKERWLQRLGPTRLREAMPWQARPSLQLASNLVAPLCLPRGSSAEAGRRRILATGITTTLMNLFSAKGAALYHPGAVAPGVADGSQTSAESATWNDRSSGCLQGVGMNRGFSAPVVVPIVSLGPAPGLQIMKMAPLALNTCALIQRRSKKP